MEENRNIRNSWKVPIQDGLEILNVIYIAEVSHGVSGFFSQIKIFPSRGANPFFQCFEENEILMQELFEYIFFRSVLEPDYRINNDFCLWVDLLDFPL